MIFISLNPFALRRSFLLFLTLLGLSVISCFGDSILLSVKTTPYDNQMTRIRSVLSSNSPTRRGGVSLALVNNWIGDLRAIPYGFSREWKTPAETQSGAPADCKAKAVSLYERMQEHGATVRLVIGKRTAESRCTHAWVEWETANGSYVLDPTINWMAYRGSDVGRSSYIPFYAYAGNRKFRAAPETLVAQN